MPDGSVTDHASSVGAPASCSSTSSSNVVSDATTIASLEGQAPA
jgi:hypothetical protein